MAEQQHVSSSSASADAFSAVLVGNLATEVTERDLLDFFAFCGPIDGFQMLSSSSSEDAAAAAADDSEEGSATTTTTAANTPTSSTKEAIIQFRCTKSADTALLLTNAVLHGRPIAVTYFRGDGAGLATPNETVSPGGSGASPVDPAQRSHTSAVASLVAAGYVLAGDALDHARRMDEGMHVTSSLLGAAAMIQQQSEQGYRMLAELFEQFDAKYSVVESARHLYDQVSASVSGVDESLHLSTSARDALNRADAGARDAYTRADTGARERLDTLQQNDFVKNALTYWDSLSASVSELSRRAQEQAEPVLSQGRTLIDSEIDEIKRAVDDAKASRAAAAATTAEHIAASATAAAAAAAEDSPATDATTATEESAVPSSE